METIVIELEGHLTRGQMSRTLALPEQQMRDGCVLVVNALGMSGYDAAAREAFVAWNREHRDQVVGVAVITSKPMWRLVVSAMGLASSQSMKAFENADEALRWARDL